VQGPLVSAIIPAYNEERSIGAAIESVLGQTYDNIEIIVVNDGSTDDTANVVRDNYPDVVLVDQYNTGLPGARNAGARAASGELLAFLDADDYWAPNKIGRQLSVLAMHREFDVLGTNGVVQTAKHTFYFNNPREPLLIELSVKQILARKRPPGASIIVRTSAFRDVCGYDPSLRTLDDIDLFTRLIAHGHRFVYLNEPLYIAIRRPGRMSVRSISVRAEFDLVALQKWDPRRDDMPFKTPYTEADYSRMIAQHVMLASCRCFLERNRERGTHYLAYVDDLPRAPWVFRFLRALSTKSWPLFGVVGGLYQIYLRLLEVSRAWGGPFGVARQLWHRYAASSRLHVFPPPNVVQSQG